MRQLALVALLAMPLTSAVVSPASPASRQQPSSAADLVAEAARVADGPRLLDARPLFEQALARARETGDRRSEARALLGLGRIQAWETRTDQSRATMGEALRVYTEVGDDLGQAWVHDVLAQLAFRSDKLEAQRQYELARSAFARAGDQGGEAKMLVSLAYTIPSKSEALASADRGLALAKQIGDTIVEGNAQHVAGDILFLTGDFAAALERLEQAAACFERANERGRLARVFVSLGRLHRAHGRGDLALESHRGALAIQESIGDRDGIIQSMNAIGSALSYLGRTDEAIEYLERALALARLTGSKYLVAFQRSNLAVTYLQRRLYQRAADVLEEGIAAVGEPYDQMVWNDKLSRAYMGLRQYERALDVSNSAVRLARANGYGEELPDVLAFRASVHRDAGRLDEALTDIREALDGLDRIRARTVPSDNMKVGFGNVNQWQYALAIDVLHRLGRDAGALETAERARARAFLDLLAARAAAAPARAATASRMIDPSADLNSAASTLPLTAAGLTALARRLGSTLLMYWVDEKRTLVWVVAPDGALHTAEIPVTAERMAQLVGLTLNSRTTGQTRGDEPAGTSADPQEEWQPRLRGAALTSLGTTSKKVWRDLHDLLIQPVRRFLPAAADSLITIVPHGPLFGLSFPALLDGDGKYLIERYRLHFAPAGATLTFTEKRKALAARPARYLFVADPAGLPREPGSAALPRLSGTTAEVNAIVRRLPAGAVTLLTGATATEERVRALASDRTVLHFATHGVLRDDAQESFLAFGSTGIDEARDGRLTVGETYDLRLHADLVVMSACRTARGRVSGDGVLGLTRAFFYAGTPSIVATLWDVADEPGARLMPAFYRRLQTSPDKSRALRGAQLDLLKALRAGAVTVKTPAGSIALKEHPFFWASYILVGEP